MMPASKKQDPTTTGERVGAWLGVAEGARDGVCEGERVGASVGEAVGLVGEIDGDELGPPAARQSGFWFHQS